MLRASNLYLKYILDFDVQVRSRCSTAASTSRNLAQVLPAGPRGRLDEGRGEQNQVRDHVWQEEGIPEPWRSRCMHYRMAKGRRIVKHCQDLSRRCGRRDRESCAVGVVQSANVVGWVLNWTCLLVDDLLNRKIGWIGILEVYCLHKSSHGIKQNGWKEPRITCSSIVSPTRRHRRAF